MRQSTVATRFFLNQFLCKIVTIFDAVSTSTEEAKEVASTWRSFVCGLMDGLFSSSHMKRWGSIDQIVSVGSWFSSMQNRNALICYAGSIGISRQCLLIDLKVETTTEKNLLESAGQYTNSWKVYNIPRALFPLIKLNSISFAFIDLKRIGSMGIDWQCLC